MIKIAIAGNIASGKSAVEGFFKDSSSDEIIKAFEGVDISTNGKIDRQKLGAVVFSSYPERKKLENIVHPLIRQRLEEYFAAHSEEKVILVAIPLIFEAKMEDLFDKIIFVFADDETRLERLMARNNFTKEDAMKRINSQMSQFMKLEESDYVFHNNGTLENLQNQVNDFCNKILEAL